MANSYLNRTPSSSGNRKTFTISAWVKISNSVNFGGIFTAWSADSSGNYFTIRFDSDRLKVTDWGTSFRQTNRLFRDRSAWYHIVVAVDTTDATADNRIKIYINGVQETSFQTNNAISQNTDTPVNNTNIHTIGTNYFTSASQYAFDGYMSHVALVDGQALAPTVFGSTDSTSGIWKFKSPTGVTWGTNGFHLKFENSGNLGLDSSGNSNTYTVNGNGRQALDTPSNVHATWNPLDGYYQDGTGSNGNTTWQTTNSKYSYRPATLGVSSGKFYWEVKYVAKSGGTDYPQIGITSTQTAANKGIGDNPHDWGQYIDNNTSYLRNNSSSSAWGTAFTVGDIVGVALDCTNNKLYLSKNGVFQESGNPSSGSNGISITAPASTPLGLYFPAFTFYDGSTNGTFSANFGNGYFGTTAVSSAGTNASNNGIFEYDVPAGYTALSTKGLNL